MDETERARLQQIATDAQVGHWPPHLGLNTDAERIEFLADRVSDLLVETSEIKGLRDANNSLVDDKNELEEKLSGMKQKVREAIGL